MLHVFLTKRRMHADVLTKERNAQQEITDFVKPTKKYHQKHPKQISVTNAVVNFVAEDLMPLSVVESDRFVELLHTLDPQYHLPTRKHLSTKLLKEKYSLLKQMVKELVASVICVNLTVNMWTNRQMHSFL